MSRFNPRTVEELREKGVAVEHPVPELLLLGPAEEARLLVSGLPLFDRSSGPELLEEVVLAGGEERAVVGPGEAMVLFQGHLWRLLEGTVCRDSAPELAKAASERPGPSEGTPGDATLGVLRVPEEEPEGPPGLALWLSRLGGEPIRPLGFVGGEQQTTFVRAPLRGPDGAPVIGPVRVSAHDVREGGRVVWQLPLEVRAGDGGGQ